MNKADMKLWAGLFEFTLQTSEWQAALSKTFAVLVQYVEADSQIASRCDSLRSELLKIGSSPESKSVLAELEKLESGRLELSRKYSADISASMELLKDFAARSETQHEKIEAFLTVLKNLMGE